MDSVRSSGTAGARCGRRRRLVRLHGRRHRLKPRFRVGRSRQQRLLKARLANPRFARDSSVKSRPVLPAGGTSSRSRRMGRRGSRERAQSRQCDTNRRTSRRSRVMESRPADVAWDFAQGRGRVMAIYHDGRGRHRHRVALPMDQHRERRWCRRADRRARRNRPAASEKLRQFPRVIALRAERHVLTLPEAIRKMTGWPATRMRLANRGTIAVGNEPT